MQRLTVAAVLALVAVIAASVAACGKTDRAQPSPAPAAAAVSVSPASQADLARDIAEAERLGTWADVQQRWQGRTVRWTVTRHGVLCSSADDCHVAAFPVQRPAAQGWMPHLAFAPGQYEALAARCGGQAVCEVTIEGTLRHLDVSPELPTSVQLSNVRIVSQTLPARTQTAHR